MPADTTTFFLSFLAVFAGIGYFLWRLEKQVTRLARQWDATTEKNRPKSGKP